MVRFSRKQASAKTRIVENTVNKTVLDEIYGKDKKMSYKDVEKMVLQKLKNKINLPENKIKRRIKMSEMGQDLINSDILRVIEQKFKNTKKIPVNHALEVEIGKKVGLHETTIGGKLLDLAREGIISVRREKVPVKVEKKMKVDRIGSKMDKLYLKDVSRMLRDGLNENQIKNALDRKLDGMKRKKLDKNKVNELVDKAQLDIAEFIIGQQTFGKNSIKDEILKENPVSLVTSMTDFMGLDVPYDQRGQKELGNKLLKGLRIKYGLAGEELTAPKPKLKETKIKLYIVKK